MHEGHVERSELMSKDQLGGHNKIGRKIFGQNSEKGSQKLFGHLLTSKGKHPCPMHLVNREIIIF
jgi:hypothetical protein